MLHGLSHDMVYILVVIFKEVISFVAACMINLNAFLNEYSRNSKNKPYILLLCT